MIERREREGEEREREKGRRRDIEREGEIRERERHVRDIERESERERHRSLPYRVCGALSLKISGKSPKRRIKAHRKVVYKNYVAITMNRNYEQKLLQEIITGNYQLVYIITRKMW
jgi:hypothetical protein